MGPETRVAEPTMFRKLDPCGALRLSCLVVLRSFRKAIGFLLALHILVGVGVLPNSVLCVDPGKHIAIESIDDLCCAKHRSSSQRPAVQTRDTCTDTVLRPNALRTSINFLPGTLSAPLPSFALPAPLLTTQGIFVRRAKPPPLQVSSFSTVLLC